MKFRRSFAVIKIPLFYQRW